MPGVVVPLPLVEHHPCRIEDAVVAPSGSPRGARAVLPRNPSFETAARRSTTPSLLARRRGTFANTGAGCAARPSTRACLGSYLAQPLEGRKVGGRSRMTRTCVLGL